MTISDGSRELKPGNVFYVGTDEGETVKFQFLRYLNEEQTKAEVEFLSGPNKGLTTIMEKELN